MTLDPDLVPMGEAAHMLGVSHAKIWRLVRDGILAAHVNALDRREKLVRRADIDRLKRQGANERRFLSDSVDDAPVAVPSSRIKEWVRQTWQPDEG